ncbi:hypothetical protein FIV42_15925 [Persicimonas caeni]|uniref:Uncharacterized protein n=1 Tax=Persicimonas caeni TaxID=2292766 RepID=A0A4Y6PV97_PERCE|nr:neuraminidase-like domain-containing protein [Persicimonas caeni]QDG52173.1 hypothetical protein FIV42_15925 [Persicimonas caeni]QED33395.1 hypothetical protein FRD00_15920 [Persicimonas caeni]
MTDEHGLVHFDFTDQQYINFFDGAEPLHFFIFPGDLDLADHYQDTGGNLDPIAVHAASWDPTVEPSYARNVQIGELSPAAAPKEVYFDEPVSVTLPAEPAPQEYGASLNLQRTNGVELEGVLVELVDAEGSGKGPLLAHKTDGFGQISFAFDEKDLVSYYGRMVQRFYFRAYDSDRLIFDSRTDLPPETVYGLSSDGIWQIDSYGSISGTVESTAQFADVRVLDADTEAPKKQLLVEMFPIGADPTNAEPVDVKAVDEFGRASFRVAEFSPATPSQGYFFNLIEDGVAPVDARPIDAVTNPASPDVAGPGYWVPNQPGWDVQTFDYRLSDGRRIKVEGQLTDSTTGEPLSGTTVEFYGCEQDAAPALTTTTNTEGRYQFAPREIAERVNRQARNFSKLVFKAPDGTTLMVAGAGGGDPLPGVHFQLSGLEHVFDLETDGTAVSGLKSTTWSTRGRLTDSGGEPLANYKVLAYEVVGAGSETLRMTSPTNENGYFPLEWSEPYNTTNLRDMRFQIQSLDGLVDVSTAQLQVDLNAAEFSISVDPPVVLGGDYQTGYFETAKKTPYEAVADAVVDENDDHITPAVTYRKAAVQDRLFTLAELGLAGEWGTGWNAEIAQPAELPQKCRCDSCTSSSSLLSYLLELVEFSAKRTEINGGAVDILTLSDALEQPIADFAVECGISERDVSQPRIAVEVLRRQIEAKHSSDGSLASRETIRDNESVARYRRAAYEALLQAIGTSYEELSTLPSAGSSRPDAAKTRQAVANRLGISEASLDGLILDPDTLTEVDLQTHFGLRATETDADLSGVTPPDFPDPLDEPSSPCTLLVAQRTALEDKWELIDRPADADALHPPIIDPDLIGAGEIVPTSTRSQAATLLIDRANDVKLWLGEIDSAMAAVTTDAAKLDAALAATGSIGFGEAATWQDSDDSATASMAELAAARAAGTKYEDDLSAHYMSPADLDYLTAVRDDIDAGTPVKPQRWKNVSSILVGARKRSNFATWRAEEATHEIVLAPSTFNLLPIEDYISPVASLSEDLSYRVDLERRQEWEDTLERRTRIWNQLEDELSQAVVDAESATMPMLRDALIDVFADGQGETLEERAHWAGEELLVDMQSDGASRTTRVAQAIESLQMMLYEARVGTLSSSMINVTLDPFEFDEAWSWLGSYESWRSVVGVLTYPENYLDLIPRQTSTPAFEQLRENLLMAPSVTAEQACKAAEEYAEAVAPLTRYGGLRIQATCEANVRVKKPSPCGTSEYDQRRLLFMFGQYSGGTPQYSTIDLDSGEQTPWKAVLADKNDKVRVFGAAEVRGSVFLYYCKPKDDGAFEFFATEFAAQDDNRDWTESLDLGKAPVSGNISVKFATLRDGELPLVVVQRRRDRRRSSASTSDRRRRGSQQDFDYWINSLARGSAWTHDEWMGGRIHAGLARVLDEPRLSEERIAHKPFDTDDYFRIVDVYAESSGLQGAVDLYLECGGHFFEAPAFYDPTEGRQSDLNAKPLRGLKGRFIAEIGDTSGNKTVLFERDGQLREMTFRGSEYAQASQRVSFLKHPVSHLDGAAPHWGGPIDGSADQSVIRAFRGELEGRPASFIQTLDVSWTYTADGLLGSLQQGETTIPVPLRTKAMGPLSRRLSDEKKALRRRHLADQFRLHQQWGTNATREYLKEYYFFVPLLLAQQLREAGEYKAAADWLRTVYDYATDADKRRIFPGLHESLAVDFDWDRDEWMRDPLDPHALAQLRPKTYARAVFIEAASLLTEWADQEFSKDTAESVPLARELYEKALQVLEEPEVANATPTGCDLGQAGERIVAKLADKHLGDADVELPALAQSGVIQMLRLLSRIDVPSARDSAVGNIESAIDTSTSLADGLVAGIQRAKLEVEELAEPDSLAQTLADESTYRNAVRQQLEGSYNHRRALMAGQARVTQRFEQAIANITGSLLDDVQNNPASVSASFLADPNEPTPQGEVYNPAFATDEYAATTSEREQELHGPYGGVINAYVPMPRYSMCTSPNPMFELVRFQARNNLRKIHAGRTISGLKRPKPLYEQGLRFENEPLLVSEAGMTAGQDAPPSQYRFKVLLQQAKNLVASASQIEGAYLSALQSRDAERFRLMEAENTLQLSEASQEVDKLQVSAAQNGLKVSKLQRGRASLRLDHYRDLLASGLIAAEEKARAALESAAQLHEAALAAQAINVADAMAVAALGAATGGASLLVGALSVGVELQRGAPGLLASRAQQKSAAASFHQTRASHARRKQEWHFQESLACKDAEIAEAQIEGSRIQLDIASQQRRLGELRTEHADETFQFLQNKFTSQELYAWMVRILRKTYRGLLQQAADVARMAWRQLVFERQEPISNPFASDYWRDPNPGGVGFNVSSDDASYSRQGLTGSARLLADIATLEDKARETNERRLQLSKTFSLAEHAPDELLRLRSDGQASLHTALELFDRDFPGHYQRLIERVSVRVVALTPVVDGISASLFSSGSSRATVSGPGYQPVDILREPQSISFTSPSGSAGMFELEPQSELLRPFEGLGVETTFDLLLPKAANSWDFNSLMDVLITVDYSAKESVEKYSKTTSQLPREVSEQRSFSLRNEFPDEWYKLINERVENALSEIVFDIQDGDFRPGRHNISVEDFRLYLVTESDAPDIDVSFSFADDSATTETAVDGMVSTRRSGAWATSSVLSGGTSPAGTWTFEFPLSTNELLTIIDNKQLSDVVLVIEYDADLPSWPIQ